MATNLELNFLVRELTDSLRCRFTDTTGDESASNTTGWSTGAPGDVNPLRSDVTAATLDYLIPTADFEIGASGGTIDLLVDFGFPASLDEFDLGSDLFGYDPGTEFPDGPWQFTLNVTALGESYTKSWVAFFRNGKICCVDTLIAGYAKPCDCKTMGKAEETIHRAKLDLYAIARAEDCQDIDSGTVAMQHLNDICEQGLEDCGCS